MHKALRAVESPRTAPSTRLNPAFTMVEVRDRTRQNTQSVEGISARGFTMVEILAAIAIIALLVAVIVPAVGNYVQMAKRTADKQTLMVLNDALTRYKTMGGDMTALTSGASIGNVLTKLQTAVTWCGMKHQFLRTGETYNSRDLGAIGEGQRYRFTKYGSFADGSVIGSDILETYADAGYDVGDEAAFDEWITQAMAETGTTNYLALTNPDTTDRFGIYARVANSGDKVRVWWGDGATQDFDSISTGSSTVIAKAFASAAKRTVVIVGDLNYISSSDQAELGGAGATNFGGDIPSMNSLAWIGLGGTNTINGDVSKLKNLGVLDVYGNNTLSGDMSKLPELTWLLVTGNNTVNGNVSILTELVTLAVTGNNTISGNLGNLTKLQFLSIQGNPSISSDGLVSLTANATGLSYIDTNTGGDIPLTQTQVDSILVNMDNNKNATKPRNDRKVDINESNHAAPSAIGLAAKASLEAAGWTVNTN